MRNIDQITIRPAREADAAGIAAITRELGWLPHQAGESFDCTEERARQQLALVQTGDCHMVMVAETESGEIAGFASWHWLPSLVLDGLEGYMSELFVRKDDRGRGLGRAILEAIKSQARSRGCSRLMLLNGRHRESYVRGFYKNSGWLERPEIANFVCPLSKTE
ncbi:MAG: GNAT family N-acetyltransferase [Deltaproteobacteria bacterium]|nr:GNAT family N-acetyltransferase [Deltaproteobacteria bacterium]